RRCLRRRWEAVSAAVGVSCSTSRHSSAIVSAYAASTTSRIASSVWVTATASRSRRVSHGSSGARCSRGGLGIDDHPVEVGGELSQRPGDRGGRVVRVGASDVYFGERELAAAGVHDYGDRGRSPAAA